MNGYTLRLSNSTTLIFVSFSMGSTLKEKNLLPQEQIHFLKSRPLFGELLLLMGANRKSQNLPPSGKMAEKHGGIPLR